MPEAPLICLVTSGHLTSTPRLLKEADTLAAAGYRVHVVASRHYAPNDPADLALMAAAPWTVTRVDTVGGPGGIGLRILKKAAQHLIRQPGGAVVSLAAWAHQAGWRRLARAAAAVPADLYLGHCLGALPAVAWAARRRGVAYGFDLEDLHDEETPEISADNAQRRATQILLTRLLPGARHLTTAAPLMRDEYRRRYRVDPQVLLNVFPRAEAPATPAAPPPVDERHPAVLYWFSQTVGPRRGLEEMLAVLAAMKQPAQLHLRGYVGGEYRRSLDALAARLGVRHPPVYLPFAATGDMARLAATAHLGLSLEQREPLNRDICLANKIFTYLLAGVPQLMSNTAAHAALAPDLGQAALLADLARPAETAATLDAWLASPTASAQARAVAARLARERYCWDLEQEIFLASIRRLVPR